MNTKQILVIHTKPSFNGLDGKEALDLSLILGSYEQNVSVVFMHQGVFQTLAHQDPESIGQKDYLSTIKALDIYDIENVFAFRPSLEHYGLALKEKLPNVQDLNHEGLLTLKNAAEHVFVF